MFGQSKFWAPTSNEGGATVAVMATVARRGLARWVVGASAVTQASVVAAASLTIVLVACVDWRLAARVAWRDV